MINFTGAACRPDKGERNDGVVQSLSCSYYFAASSFRRRGWRRGAAGDAVLERSRSFLQLSAPRLGENQREAGVDGSGRESDLRLLLKKERLHIAIKKPPIAMGNASQLLN